MSAGGKLEILLVEDDADDAETAIRALRLHHLAEGLRHVKDGAEALDFIFGRGAYADRDLEQQPRMILLDLTLPGVSGVDVLRAIKSNERTTTIPVVAMSSCPQQQDLADCYRLGANSYIVKPVDVDSYSKAVPELVHYWIHLNLLPDAPA